MFIANRSFATKTNLVRIAQPSLSFHDVACKLEQRACTHDLLSEQITMTQSELPLALRAAYLALHRRSEAAFAAHGVTADQFVLLATLAQGDALTQRELARRMPSDPSTVRAMLVLLERQGLVQRHVHPSDSRARTVALTVAGTSKFRQLWTDGEPIRAQMVGSLGADELSMLVSLLKKVAESLNAEQLPKGDAASNRNEHLDKHI